MDGARLQAAEVSHPRYQVKSALLWKRGTIEPHGTYRLPTQDYHGSYVASAVLRIPGLEVPVVTMSVHASPSPVEERYRDAWVNGAMRGLPQAREGGGRHDGQLFDADLLLESIRVVAEGSLVLAAGDFNECLAWDRDHVGQTWGELYFDRLRSYGLVPILHDRWTPRPGAGESKPWGVERPTSFGVGLQPYQLDHIVTSTKLSDAIAAPAEPEPPSPQDVASGRSSDHAPVWFTIG